MNSELVERLVKLIAPDGYSDRTEAVATYPARTLPAGAYVTRICPSPTGFVHIGTIYAALAAERLAHQSGGVVYLRVEDTDKKREVPGAIEQITSAFAYFGISLDEGLQADGTSRGEYGPYVQSEREKLYLGFAVDLLRSGRAYPCFATSQELDASYRQQQAEKVRPGYYGKWALWRDRSDQDIAQALDAGKPFVLRFRSQGSHQKRIQYTDALKGTLDLPQNDLDVPIIKSGEYHLPTYHLAHVVDDYLMGTTLVSRGEEWLPSTPLHMELCEALGIPAFNYAHFSVITIMDGTSKRKLSKRKDPQANVQYFIDAGYPPEAVIAYLIGLANSSYEDWAAQNQDKSVWDYPFSLERWATARNPLLDMKKLDDISKNLLGDLSQAGYEAAILEWAKQYKVEFYTLLTADPEYTHQVLSIERDGDQKRKDLAKLSDAPDHYGYFYDEYFTSLLKPQIASELADISEADQRAVLDGFLQTYDPADDQQAWFDKVKVVADNLGYAVNMKDYKKTPEQFKGSVADVAKIIRVRLTGKNRTPDLCSVMKIMGEARVRERLS